MMMWVYIMYAASISVCVLILKSSCLCVVKAQQVFLVFRAVRRRPLQGRGVGGRCDQHARLWDSLESGRGRSPPRFPWWTVGPYSAWLRRRRAVWEEIEETGRRWRKQRWYFWNPFKKTLEFSHKCNHSLRIMFLVTNMPKALIHAYACAHRI